MIKKIAVVFLVGLFASSSALGRSLGEVMSNGANKVVPRVLSSRSAVLDFVNAVRDWEVVGISEDGSVTTSDFQDYQKRKETYISNLIVKRESALAALNSSELAIADIREEVQQLMDTYCYTIRTADSIACNRIMPFRESLGAIYTEVVLLKDRLENIPGQIAEEFVYITDTLRLNGFRSSDRLDEDITSLRRKLMEVDRNVELSPSLMSYSFGEQEDYYRLLYRLKENQDR